MGTEVIRDGSLDEVERPRHWEARGEGVYQATKLNTLAIVGDCARLRGVICMTLVSTQTHPGIRVDFITLV